jgi:hypothetical protein
MKDELKECQERLKAVKTGYVPGKICFGQGDSIVEGCEDDDPRLQEAMIKMQKLEKILEKKIKQEKEVKRNRILFEKR